jgi:hypothetical protein
MHQFHIGPDHPVTVILALAEELHVGVSRHSRRLIRPQVGFGAASLVAVLTVGMFDNPLAVVAGAWVAALSLLSACVVRQRVERRATSITHSAISPPGGCCSPACWVSNGSQGNSPGGRPERRRCRCPGS